MNYFLRHLGSVVRLPLTNKFLKYIRLAGLTVLGSISAALLLGLFQGSLTQAQGLPPDADGVAVFSALEITLTPERQGVNLNDSASFVVTINNSGGSTLTNITVSAPATADCSRTAGSLSDLAPGASLSYTCQSSALSADLINDLSADADDNGTPVSASARAFVDVNSLIAIDVQPLEQFALAGQIVTFTVTITNLQSSQPLTNISVDAPEVPDCSRSSGVLSDLAASASLTYTCQIQMPSNLIVNNVSAFAESPINLIDVDPTTVSASATAGVELLHLPILFSGFTFGPDLVVDNLVASSSAVTVTIRNAGTETINDSFWVDVYFNPNQTPTINHPWKSIAPAGAVWGVTKSLAPGESLILTSGGTYYFGPPESSPLPFPSGVSVYALVDSVNYNTGYGNVRENNETNNVLGPVVSTAGGGPPTLRPAEAPSQQDLPPR